MLERIAHLLTPLVPILHSLHTSFACIKKLEETFQRQVASIDTGAGVLGCCSEEVSRTQVAFIGSGAHHLSVSHPGVEAVSI